MVASRGLTAELKYMECGLDDNKISVNLIFNYFYSMHIFENLKKNYRFSVEKSNNKMTQFFFF